MELAKVPHKANLAALKVPSPSLHPIGMENSGILLWGVGE